MAASRPPLPAISLGRSYPVTFFTTLPPATKISPRPETAVKPSRWSRALPAVTRREPATPAAITPPIVAAPASTPNSRSEEHTSELQSLMRISYAVFCLKKKINHKHTNNQMPTQNAPLVLHNIARLNNITHNQTTIYLST